MLKLMGVVVGRVATRNGTEKGPRREAQRWI